jgi:RNA binding exosome subunit
VKPLRGASPSHIPIPYIDIRFFAHATEDLNKVVEAVHRLLPPDHVDEIVFKRSNLKGHYGNPILLFETRIKKREIVKAVVETLSSGLGELDKEVLLDEIGSHMEKGSLYIRLDKQAAFQGEFKLCSADPVRIRIRFRKQKLEGITKTCRELGLLRVRVLQCFIQVFSFLL